MEITQPEQKKKERILKRRQHLKRIIIRDFWHNIKHMNIHIIDVPEGGEREREGSEKLLEAIELKTSQTWG